MSSSVRGGKKRERGGGGGREASGSPPSSLIQRVMGEEESAAVHDEHLPNSFMVSQRKFGGRYVGEDRKALIANLQYNTHHENAKMHLSGGCNYLHYSGRMKF